MDDRHDVAALRVVELEEILGGPRRRDLIGRPVVVDERRPAAVEPRVLVPELDDHGLLEVVDERDQAHGLALDAALVDELEARSGLNRPLGEHDEVLALGEAVLILDVVVAPVHRRTDLAAGEGELDVPEVSHVPLRSRRRSPAARGRPCRALGRRFAPAPAVRRASWPAARRGRRPAGACS